MDGQVEFYDHFGERHRQSILDCPEPELWTTDYQDKGRIYQEMKERLKSQERFIKSFFKKEDPVLDIGCGYGRQASWLGRNGFRVVGIDSSHVFIGLAKRLFQQQGYEGEFFTGSLMDFLPSSKFKQVLLLDVLEHFPPSKRCSSVERIQALMEQGGILILSIPHIKDRFSSRVNNSFVRRFKSQFSYFLRREEHPYPIPTKKQVMGLFSREFTCLEFLSSPPTDYYIFQKR